MTKQGWVQQGAPERAAAWYWTALFGAVFFLAVFRSGAPAALALDDSWAAVMGWARLQDVQWGKDLLFTYGPLGYLFPRATYYPPLFDTFLLGQLLLALGYTFIFTCAFRRLATAERILLALIAVLACRRQPDTLLLGTAIFAVVALDDLIRRSRDTSWAWLGLGVVALMMNTLGLLKFTVLPLSVLLCGVGVVLLLRERRPAAALAWVLLWLGSLALLWLGHGQSLAAFPGYVLGALEVAAGYSISMGVDSKPEILAAGLLMLAFTIALLLIWWRRETPRDLRVLVLLGYLAFALFVAWRNAYTRADMWHVTFFFPLAAFVLLASWALGRWRPQRLIRYGCALFVVLYAAGIVVLLVSPPLYREYLLDGLGKLSATVSGTLRAQHEAQYQAKRTEWDLASFRRLIGEARVDVFGCTQAVAIWNGFNYAPRPIFQSYSAYTPGLQRRNEAHYLGPQAPPFVIFAMCPIDARLPASDDALALLALLRNYRPVAAEKGYVLLQRDAAARPAPQPVLAPQRTLKLGEWMDVADGASPQVLQLDYRLNLAGRLRAMLLREPMLKIELQLADGQLRSNRLVRQVAQTGFLLSPALENEAAYLRWYYGQENYAVTRFRLVPERAGQDWLFQPVIQLASVPADLAQGPAAEMPADMATLLYPNFSPLPAARSGGVSTRGIGNANAGKDEQPVVLMQKQAALEFSPEPGQYRLQAELGVRKRAKLDFQDCLKAAPIFSLQRIDAAGGAELLQQHQLEPGARAPVQVEIPRVSLLPGQRLRLAASGVGCEGSYVSRFELTAAPP